MTQAENLKERLVDPKNSEMPELKFSTGDYGCLAVVLIILAVIFIGPIISMSVFLIKVVAVVGIIGALVYIAHRAVQTVRGDESD